MNGPDNPNNSGGPSLQGLGLGLFGVGLLVAVAASLPLVYGQISVSGRGKNFVAPVTDAQGKRTVLRGDDVRPTGGGLVEITKMQAETFRGQKKDMVFEAPQCLFDTKANVASSKDSLFIHTTDSRFSLQGKAFRWQLGDFRASSKLVISNEVHSQVRKRLIAPKPGGAPAQSGTPATGAIAGAPAAAAGGTNDFIHITSQAFEYQTDRAVFRGQVRAHDAEGDLACEELTILFQGENGSVERIEAARDVVLEQMPTRAQADQAHYELNAGTNLVEFVGHAVWTDGQRQGSGERLVFDRGARILHAYQSAYLKVPKATFGEAGLFSAFPSSAAHSAGERNATNTFLEVYSDLMTIHLPLTNGPVREFLAEHNVLIMDPDQEGRALADKAEYLETTGLLKLTGSPMLQSQGRLITGQTLTLDRATRVLTAAPDSYVKLPMGAVQALALPSETLPASTNKVAGTNQFIEVWSRQFEYHTNLFSFQDQVRANLLEGDASRGKLTCASLVLHYGERLENLVAERNVEVEQFMIQGDPRQTLRKANCERLTVEFSPEGRLKTAFAEEKVSGEMEETQPGEPMPVLSKLSSDWVRTTFLGASNQVETMTAEKDVSVAQGDRSAHGSKAVYTGTNGLMVLTGEPTATMPEGRILEAERLIWDRLRNRFITQGKFRSEWTKPPSQTKTNVLAKPTALAK